MPRYTFRPATHDDLPMLRTWLVTPEVVRWWGDAAEQYALLEENLGNPLMVMRIVACDGRPFAYVQDYDVHTWRRRISRICPKARAASTRLLACPT
jgi:aminoglycoside 6'-N-acetyltransferase